MKTNVLALAVIAIALFSCRTSQPSAGPHVASALVLPTGSTIKPLTKENVFGPIKENDDHYPFTVQELTQIQFRNDGEINLVLNKQVPARRIIGGVVFNIDSAILKNHSIPSHTLLRVIRWEGGGRVLYLRDDSLRKTVVRYQLDEAKRRWYFTPPTNSKDFIYNKDTFEFSPDSRRSFLVYDERGSEIPVSEPTQSSGSRIRLGSDAAGAGQVAGGSVDSPSNEPANNSGSGYVDDEGRLIEATPQNNQKSSTPQRAKSGLAPKKR